MSDLVWFELRAPGCVPQRKGPFRGKAVVPFLRELMDARPGEFITVLTVDPQGYPCVQDGPEYLMIADGRSRARALRHIRTSRAAFAASSPHSPIQEDADAPVSVINDSGPPDKAGAPAPRSAFDGDGEVNCG